MKIDIHWEGMDRLEEDFNSLSRGMQGQALRGALKAAAKPVIEGAKAKSPSKRVARSLIYVVTGSGTQALLKIGARKKSAGNRLLHLIEKGVKGHEIAVRKKRVLAGRGMIFGRHVSHPGMKAEPFFLRALPENAGQAEVKFANAMRAIISSMQLRVLKRELRAGGVSL